MLENENHTEDSQAARQSENDQVLMITDQEDMDMAMLKPEFSVT